MYRVVEIEAFRVMCCTSLRK